jgi:hypothetical protein
MGRLGRWCIRTRIPHFGEDEYPFIFLMFLRDTVWYYCMCEYECDSRVGEWSVGVIVLIMFGA